MQNVSILMLLVSFFATPATAQSSFQVTDVATRGLTAQRLFDEMRTGWMDLKHSICANRALIWRYDMEKKHKIKTGAIFIFFSEVVWANDKKNNQWAYHAGSYVIENGKELVIEGSYPDEVSKPLSIVEWMDNEMEGRADAKACIEITAADTDITEYFYTRANAPRWRKNGKPSAPCYYRKAPGYIPYPVTLAMLDTQKDENDKPINYTYDSFDSGDVFGACVDSYVGRKFFRRFDAKSFCGGYL